MGRRFSFYVNRFPREDTTVRALMLAAMLAAAILATNVGGALTHETAIGFALSYAGLRACLVLLYLRARRDPAARELADFYAAGFGLGAALWAASVAVPEPARYAVWAVAFIIEAATPALAGERLLRAPPINATHLPERFGLFVIIVLGEVIVAVGAGFSKFGSSLETALAGAGCFALAAAVWWTYFDIAISGMARRAVVAVIAMITPDRCLVMWRAAALVVRKCVRMATSIGRTKSSNDMSSNRKPCRSSRPMALKDTSMPPTLEATASAWASTARSSRASTCAVSTAPPAAESSSATSSRVARVRPARTTLAPSRAKAAATARPIDPAPP
jgi:Bacterial low temperature requirement A protein (LtrA)